MMDFIGELLLHRNVRHLHAFAAGSELPSVIRTAKPIVFHAAEKKWTEPMRAISADQSDFADARAKKNEIFTQKLHSYLPSARFLEIGHRRDRNPILPKEIS